EPAARIPLSSGAQGETRTRMPRGATPSRWCVYQFHHLGIFAWLFAPASPPERARVYQRAPTRATDFSLCTREFQPARGAPPSRNDAGPALRGPQRVAGVATSVSRR